MSLLPKSITVTLYIIAQRKERYENREGGPYLISVSDYDLSKLPPSAGANPRILLGTTVIQVAIPENNPVDLEIEALKKVREQVLAQAHLTVTGIDGQIQTLLALEHQQ